MPDNEQLENMQKEIGLTEIVNFCKMYYKKIFWFGIVSTIIVLFLIAALFVFLPKNVNYVAQLVLQLQRGGGNLVYPSGKAFSANDIISVPVLRQVYENNKVGEKIEFGEFCKLFSLGGRNVEKEMLSVLYKSKLSKKNLTIVEIKALEEEYAEAMRVQDSGSVKITMVKTSKLTQAESEKILREVPIVWFEIFSKHEAKVMPSIATMAQVQELRKNSTWEGWLVTLDKTRIVCNNLSRGCLHLKEMLMGQKVSLPSGEYLDDLLTRLSVLEKHRIRPTLLLVRETPGYKNAMDKVFLRSTILMLDRQIEVLKEKYEGTIAAINILHPEAAAGIKKNVSVPAAGSSAPMTLNLDGNFFASVAALIRNSQSIKLREKYADKVLVLKGNIAELESEKKYYQAIYDGVLHDKASGNTLTVKEFENLTRVMFNELLELSVKVNAFKELILNNYMTNRNFFATSGEVMRKADFILPFKKIAIGLIFLLVLVNGVNVGVKFYSAYNRKELFK